MGLAEDIKQQKKFDNAYEKLIVNLIYTNSWLTEQQMRLFKPFGITAHQYNVLRILRNRYPEPHTVSAIIERMLDRMSNVSRIISRLETKRLVVREVCEEDRRAKDVLITDEGLLLLRKLDEAFETWLRGFMVPIRKIKWVMRVSFWMNLEDWEHDITGYPALSLCLLEPV